MFKRAIIFIHRWLGVVLCLLFALWFPSGIGMMYWDFPSVTAGDRLDRSAALDPSTIRFSPADAYAALGETAPATQVRLNTFDGRPVYRFRTGRDERLVYADTGALQIHVPEDLMRRAAAAWTGQRVERATISAIDVDQWTVQGTFRALQPLWKYAWPNGEQVYVSGKSGEVVQYTTSASRLGAYLGPIPHWFYFTPLRKHQPAWSRVVIWTSGVGTVTSLLGIVIGVWMSSPRRRRKIPYRGQKWWHAVFGLIFGLSVATWAFSGMLSMDPFPIERRRGDRAGIARTLRGTPRLADFARRHPRDVVAALADRNVRELELATVVGEPAYLVTLKGGETRVVTLDGPPRLAFDSQRIADAVRRAAGSTPIEIESLDRYDRYYLDRRGRRPLPVILARLAGAGASRYYIDPRTARVVGTYSSANWVSRWLYHGLHSLDFPWLYAYRPLWDIVMIVFMLGGTALSVTSIILAWRVVDSRARSSVSHSRA